MGNLPEYDAGDPNDPEPPEEPTLVNVTNEQPISVQVEDSVPVSVKVAREVQATRNTTADKAVASAKVDSDKLKVADQRRISGIWERTQQLIALSVVWISLLVATIKSVSASISGQESTEAGVAFVFLASVANLVIGFYFGRTNHQKVGGDATSSDQAIGR